MLCGRIKELATMLANLCRFLYEHKSALGALAGMTAGQLGWAGRTVVSVTPDTCAMVALSLMRDREVAGIGVVSQSGALIGNFSYSDLRSADACLTYHDNYLLGLLQGSLAGSDCTLVSSALGRQAVLILESLSCAWPAEDPSLLLPFPQPSSRIMHGSRAAVQDDVRGPLQHDGAAGGGVPGAGARHRVLGRPRRQGRR